MDHDQNWVWSLMKFCQDVQMPLESEDVVGTLLLLPLVIGGETTVEVVVEAILQFLDWCFLL